MQQIEFRVGAKAARLIGRENIADVDGALIELIKNAYDADATCVCVDFYVPFPDIPDKVSSELLSQQLSEKELEFVRDYYVDRDGSWEKQENLSEEIQSRLRDIFFSHNRIIVADNGTGMTMDIVESAWMYIGTSNKETNIISDKGRIKTGAKGIGRFALDKLSLTSTMYTKAKESRCVVCWRMDWEQFANARLISDVKAELELQPIEYQEIAQRELGKENQVFKEHQWSTGTLIILQPTREAWSERLFQKVNTNLKSINPIGSVDRFEVIVNNAFYPKFNYRTEKVAIDKEDYDYRIKAEYDGNEILRIKLLRNEVDLSRKQITVEAYGASKKVSVEEFWARKNLQKEGYRKEDYNKEITLKKNVKDILPSDNLEKIQRVGPFSVEMYFLRNANNEYAVMKRVAVSKRKKLLFQFSGIKLYRDDFKVRPYGDEGAMYDWLGLGGRVQKSPAPVAHRTGAWRVQPYQMIGLVKIGRKTNPNLEDMANREGIALTDTYYIFVHLLQESVREFEFDRQYIYREYARWIESIEDELADYAKKVQEEAVRRATEKQTEENKRGEDEGSSSGEQKGTFTEDEMLGTVYKLMQDSEKALNSKQILQVLSSSGILLNTFFHEFNAINTQFHVEAAQLRSRVRYILKGQEYVGIPAYNPYNRIDTLEKNDRLTAAFLDVIMDGLKKENLSVQKNSLRKMLNTILSPWKVMLEEKHIQVFWNPEEAELAEDDVSIALVDMYIILNNFILNSAWFLEQEYNPRREIVFRIAPQEEEVHLFMENNGPGLAERFRDNPDKIFEIGETSKGDKGTGLGLWIVKETVERNDGTISVMSKDKGFGLEIVWRKPERRK